MSKRCVFCGDTDVKFSNEHAWPNWIRSLFPAGHTAVFRFRRPTGEEPTVHRHHAKGKRGQDMGLTVNVVCKVRCNEGWMDKLEEEVRPFLSSCIRNGSPVTFTPKQQSAVATWACKTAMVFEF